MTKPQRSSIDATIMRFAVAIALVFTVAACMHHHQGRHHEEGQTLTGANEVPPNTSTATGVGNIRVLSDGSVSGTVSVSGMTATMAHIHEAPPGVNGKVIVPLTQTGANSFAAPAGAKLTEAQYASYLAGNLYVNVHSAAHPGGEVRAQLAAPR